MPNIAKRALTSSPKRSVAIFDIDGTIFRSSLLVELTEALIQSGIFTPSVRKIYGRAYKNWLNRKGPYEQYIAKVVEAFEAHIKGVRSADFLAVAEDVVKFHQNRIYRFTRDLLAELKKKNYYLLAISHSPKEILDRFGKELGFDKIYGRIYELDKRDKLTGRVLYTDFISDKAKVLERALAVEDITLKNSVGVGDTESDIGFLKMVENPICFNPNAELHKYAKKSNWKIVVERKDVIYHL
ncbi:MAG: HAD family phosphatase [Candidatus Liptonbacteria bacterium]|nr:HAD family phosphatase [Candidatus Liptonbacteria bacterium]